MTMAGKYQRGSAIAETAIVLPVALLLLFGLIDFGRAMYTYAYVAQLARQGARWAIVRGSGCTVLTDCNATSAQVQTYVQSLSIGLTNSSNTTATTTWSCPSWITTHTTGCNVTVTVTVNFSFILPNLPKATLPLTSSSTMPMAQ